MNIPSTQATGVEGEGYPPSGAAAALGKDDFMKLLVAQLQRQDPLDPLANAEFVAQLAQFSTLEGISNMGSSLDTMTSYIMSMNNYNATGLIGKDIKAYGDTLFLEDGGTADIAYHLYEDAPEVKISIYDESGALVRTIEGGGRPAGSNEMVWDGRDSDGNLLPPGKYTFAVTATDGNGSGIRSDTILTGTVSGVIYEDGIPYLMVGDEKIAMSDILEVWKG